MEKLKRLEGKEVLSKDGKYMGKVLDFTYHVDDIKKILVKMNKDILEDIGEDKPMLSSVKRTISIERVKAFSDNVVLYDPLSDLHGVFQEFSEENLISSLKGMKINCTEGRDVGHVKDILVDVENWTSPSLLVKLNKDILETLDLKSSILSKNELAISMEHVERIRDRIMLDKSADEIGDIIDKEPIKKV